MKVRQATIQDVEFLVNSATTMAFETEGKQLEKQTVTQGITNCIDNPKVGCYYVAFKEEEPEKLLGTLMLTYEVSVAQGGMIYWIQSVYVVQEARRMGVFRSLYNHVVDQAKFDKFVKCVRLYVETQNFKAQQVYEALGMTKLDDFNFDERDFIFGH